jgi:hypothetical protein
MVRSSATSRRPGRHGGLRAELHRGDPFLGLFVGSGQYKFLTHWKATCAFTNTMTTDAYRGADGRKPPTTWSG